MKRFGAIVWLVAFLAAYQAVGIIWGKEAKIKIGIGLAVLYLVLIACLLVMRKRIAKDMPEMAEEMDRELLTNWQWNLLDACLGVCFFFGPGLIVMWARHEQFSWNMSVKGYHILAMFAGFGVYFLGRTLAIRWWKRKHGIQNGSGESN